MQTTTASRTHSPIFPADLTALVASMSCRFGQLRWLGGVVPPSGFVLLSSFSAQVGAALAKSLFETLGTIGAVFICRLLAALLLLLVHRPRLRQHCWHEYVLVWLMGLAVAGMGLAFYGAIERIPLGLASTIEFVGPLGIALLGSRRLLDLIWVLVAAVGVVLLSPIGGAVIDPTGVALALLSAACWAIYILISVPVGRIFSSGTGLALAIAAATVLLAPIGVAQAGTALVNPMVLMVGVAVACLGNVVPYSLEFAALKRVPARIFGVLMSIEPAIAALVGFLFLGEQLGMHEVAAIGLVSLAAIGVTITGRSPSDDK
jgi:inner membrane transporter RhtA